MLRVSNLNQIDNFNVPGANESKIEVRNQLLRLAMPLCDSFSSLDYLSQIPMAASKLDEKYIDHLINVTLKLRFKSEYSDELMKKHCNRNIEYIRSIILDNSIR